MIKGVNIPQELNIHFHSSTTSFDNNTRLRKKYMYIIVLQRTRQSKLGELRDLRQTGENKFEDSVL